MKKGMPSQESRGGSLESARWRLDGRRERESQLPQ